MNEYGLLNKVVLFITQDYIQRTVEAAMQQYTFESD